MVQLSRSVGRSHTDPSQLRRGRVADEGSRLLVRPADVESSCCREADHRNGSVSFAVARGEETSGCERCGNHVEQTGQCCVEVDRELGSRERIFDGDTGRVSRWVTGVGVSVDLLQDAELSWPGSEYTEHAT